MNVSVTGSDVQEVSLVKTRQHGGCLFQLNTIQTVFVIIPSLLVARKCIDSEEFMPVHNNLVSEVG